MLYSLGGEALSPRLPSSLAVCRHQSLTLKHKVRTLGGEYFPWDLCIWRLREMDSTLLDNTLVIIRAITDPFELPAPVITLLPLSLSCLFRFLLFQTDPEIADFEMAFRPARESCYRSVWGQKKKRRALLRRPRPSQIQKDINISYG